MLTSIELYFVCYFCLAFFMHFAVAGLLGTNLKLIRLIIFGIIFCLLKFVQDYFAIKLIYQVLICGVYFAVSSIFLHKTKHITRLVQVVVVCVFYYLCLLGCSTAITGLVLGEASNYISNFYLLNMFGLNLILYSISVLVSCSLKSKRALKLMHCCSLKIKGKNIPISGFLDTGNSLTDQQSGLPVVVVNLSAIKKYLSSKMYADILFATNASGSFNGIHKLKYATVSGVNFMTVFTPAAFTVGGKPVNVAVGITGQNTSNCDALLNLACQV